MIINIYGLVYPSTQEVIYVGQTYIYKPYGYNWKYIE